MSKYCIRNDILIRSYTDAPYVTFRKGKKQPRRITAREFCVLNACDGRTELDDGSEIVRKFLEHGYIRRSLGPDDTVQVDYRVCRNRMMSYMTLEITQRCNFNCIHCFNAADTGLMQEQMSYENVCRLLDQAAECGVFTVLVTGGEPFLHPDLMRILKAIYDRDMTVYELNTNGYFLTRDLLRTMKEYGIDPILKISFDGIGTHDIIRNFKGCEERTLNAIRMAIEEGFEVAVNMNMNRMNEGTILPSLLLLNEYGVKKARIIRTSESPRWSRLYKDASLPWEEYYEKVLSICAEYIKHDPVMDIESWMFLYLWTKQRRFACYNIKQCGEGYDPNGLLCRCTGHNISIEADGNAVPCMQMSGALKAVGVSLGNVFETPLPDLIDTKGTYFRTAGAKISDKCRQNAFCAACPYLPCCGGGCTALGIIYEKKYFGTDHTACIFFRDRWFFRISERLAGWKCAQSIPELDDGGYLDAVSDRIDNVFAPGDLEMPI